MRLDLDGMTIKEKYNNVTFVIAFLHIYSVIIVWILGAQQCTGCDDKWRLYKKQTYLYAHSTIQVLELVG